MLTGLDEFLFHQIPDPVVVVGTPDHRFFDRYWFSGVAPDGEVAFFAGTGRYANLSTRDAFLNVVIGTRQHNVRISREIEVVADAAVPHQARVGPFLVDVQAPFRTVRLAVDEGPIRADLTFTTAWPHHLEARHREMSGHRLVQEQTRYDQAGTWEGWLEVEGERVDVRSWWGDRDHSWGVRVDVGGLEPPALSRRSGSLTIWCNFSTASSAGLVHFRQYDDGSASYLDGRIVDADGRDRRVVGLQHEVAPGRGGWARARLQVGLDDGRELAIEATPLGRAAWASRGGGYNRGFADGKGFGARRGEVHEHDAYDLSDPSRVLLDGVVTDPGHREQLATLMVDGEPGCAHMPIMSRSGVLSRQDRGLDDENSSNQ